MRSPLVTGLHEVWEDGQAFKDLRARIRALTESKASIEAARKVRDSTLLRGVPLLQLQLMCPRSALRPQWSALRAALDSALQVHISSIDGLYV